MKYTVKFIYNPEQLLKKIKALQKGHNLLKQILKRTDRSVVFDVSGPAHDMVAVVVRMDDGKAKLVGFNG